MNALRRFRVGVVLATATLAVGVAAIVAARDARALGQRRLSAAVAAASAIRQQGAAAVTTFRGYGVTVLGAAPGYVALMDSLRRDEAPRLTPDGAIAPLRDTDDWDVVGAVQLTARPGGEPAQARVVVVLALAVAGLLPLAGLLLWWSGRTTDRRRQETLVAWTFLGPTMLHLVLFSFVPVAFTIYLSFHDWNLVAATKPYVGLANYRAVAGDPLFWTSLRNTALYVLYVPITMAAALALALLLNRQRRGEQLLRAVMFLPYITSAVAIGIVWQWMFNPDFGLINRLLGTVGLPAVDWLGNPKTALAAIIAVTVWTQVGYQMLVLLAGLQGIPQHFLDAARVDGAGAWQRLRHVTLPLLRPVLLFVLVTGVIGGFQVFTLVYLMTEGGPLHSTDVVVYRIYQTAWEFLRFGQASAMAVVLLGILLAATLVQFRLLGRRIEQ